MRVLVLTSFDGDDKLLPAIRADAQGHLLKATGPEDLVEAIHDVHGGESSLHPSVARKVLKALTGPSSRPAQNGSLTDREVEALRLVAQGPSDLEISHQLTISEATVRTQAALYALREGLAPLHDTERWPHA